MSTVDGQCSVRTCISHAVGRGGRTPQPLCQRHLAQDTDRVRELQASVQKRLQPVKEEQERTRTEQQRLTAELQEADELFDAALDSLRKWKDAVVSRLTARHDSALQEMREFAVLQEYESAVAAAESANDLRRVFELTSQMELECSDLEERLTACDAESLTGRGCAGGGRRMVGDVSGGVRDLQLLIDRHMRDVMQLCESVDTACQSTADAICEPLFQLKDVGDTPFWVTSCSNTNGFVGDASGRVMKAESASEDTVRLPEPCLFVSFHSDQKKDHLLVMSVDGSVRLRCHCDIDWGKFVTGLHCDSRRQLLFASQPDAVTVTDLSGRVSRVMNASSLGQSVGNFGGIGGNSDKVFVFDHKEKKVLGIGKDGGELQTVIRVDGFCGDFEYATGLSVVGNKILLTDRANGQVHKVCTMSQQLITTFPTEGSKLKSLSVPIDVICDNRGLIFVSELGAHVVRVLSSDGAVLQTLGTEGQPGIGDGSLNSPYGLAVVEGEPRMLAVVNLQGKSIAVFKLRR